MNHVETLTNLQSEFTKLAARASTGPVYPSAVKELKNAAAALTAAIEAVKAMKGDQSFVWWVYIGSDAYGPFVRHHEALKVFEASKHNFKGSGRPVKLIKRLTIDIEERTL